MKYPAGLLALVAAAVIAGCSNDNNVLLNFPQDATDTRANLGKQIPQHRIPIHVILHEPSGMPNSFLQIDGNVDYNAIVLQRDPIPSNPQSAAIIDLTLNADAVPFGYDDPVWLISASSHDEMELSQDGLASMTKRYAITGRVDGVRLCITYRISNSGVDILRLWLELPKVVQAEENR